MRFREIAFEGAVSRFKVVQACSRANLILSVENDPDGRSTNTLSGVESWGLSAA